MREYFKQKHQEELSDRETVGASLVSASAPGKLMLFGEHAVVYGYPCIATAVDQRIRAVAQNIPQPRLEIEAPDVGVTNYEKGLSEIGLDTNIFKGVRFVETAIKNFRELYPGDSGLLIQTSSEFSSEFGFGSSSAVTVAVLKAISGLNNVFLTNEDLFRLSYQTVGEVQGVGSGFDLAAAIWGGTINFIAGGKEITPLAVGELSLVVGYTGIKADTPSLIRQVAELYRRDQKWTEGIFGSIASITKEARTSLTKGDWERTGELMNLNQELLVALGVNTKELSRLISAARDAGAWGAKLSGAGGGDCMIALADSEYKKNVEEAIEKVGGKVLRVTSNAEGARIE